MKKIFVVFALLCAVLLASCGGGSDSGNGKEIQISFLLPVDAEGICDEDEDYNTDRTNCIDRLDQVITAVYAKNSLSGEYVFVDEKIIPIEENVKNSFGFSFKLKESYKYLRVFAKVADPNGRIKLSGGVDNLTQNDQMIFLAPAGDFARVVSDRINFDRGSLKSYFTEDGSKGAAAVALKDGNIYMAGGYDLDEDEVSKKAVIFNMKSLSVKEVAKLPVPLYDHIAALLDDGSETGKVVVGFGKNDDGDYESAWIYDPESDKYTPIPIISMTNAKSITIDGDVYIVGGCTENGASNAVFRISAKTGSVSAEQFAMMQQGRCNHAIADLSTNGKVRILVLGGSTNNKPEGRETPVVGGNFAEIVTEGSSKAVEITDRTGGDDHNLKETGLISPAAATLTMDDKGTAEKIIAVTGGYTNTDNTAAANPNTFVLSEKDGKLVYDADASTFECARPSMAALGTWKNDFSAYAAVNCGTYEHRDRSSISEQLIFVLQVRRNANADGKEVFSSSVKKSVMEGNRDPESDAEMVDGPVAADALGQVFMFGGKYVYKVGSYAIPGTVYENAPKTKMPMPIIHVAFEYPFQEPMSYRSIYDKVQMNLKDTCVSDPDAPGRCLEDWENKYYIQYKWEMTESPTPLREESRLYLTESDDSAGQWILDDGTRDNPKRANFTGLVITPRKSSEENPSYDPERCSSECGEEPADNGDKYFFKTLSDYFICRQKFCEETKTEYYKIKIQAETVDKKTGFISDPAEITVVPRIIPQARVVAQLTWKQGFKTKAESESKEGAAVDLDLHLIKKNSIEAAQYGFTPTEGLLGTRHASQDTEADCPVTLPECEHYWRHDDCSFDDNGLTGVDEDRTIQWHASLDIDSTWGGGNYQNPETIGLGPIIDNDFDGVPDYYIIEDQYLLVVGYVACTSKYADGVDRCRGEYTGTDSFNEIDARVEIFVDGMEVPRSGTSDKYSASTKDFKIKFEDWKAIAVIKWDSGNAIVTDSAMPDEGITTDPVNHPVCNYPNTEAKLIPIWDANVYVDYITTPNPDTNFQIGICN